MTSKWMRMVADDRSVTDEGRDDHIVMTCT
jgi:hypothetical protein